MSRYLVVIFVIDEGERLHRQLDRMGAVGHGLDVVVADGGSRDGSTARALLEPRGVRALLTRRDAGGLSAQMRMAFAFGLDEGYEGIVTIDGNDKDDPSAIPQFAAALDRGVDHVQGSRYLPGGHHEHTPWLRHIGVRLLHAPMISRAAGVKYTDTTNGFRAYRAGFLRDPRVAPFRHLFSRYELHYYLAIRAGELGFRVEEIPVTRRYPPRGRTPTKISPLRGSALVLRTLWRAARHRYDPAGGAT
jgi:glycosyltransferase involved in cell wall biosynthesis